MNRIAHPRAAFDDAAFDENPEWTERDFAAARPAGEILPEHVARALIRGPQPEEADQRVTLLLDQDVLDKFRATGPGWQSRINDALRAAKV